ncbi:MAG: GNAT family N-acetyltransferase [Lachnospiraceae bacterium]|nr:GNAT family N-acetyltransferase [Lachnospiraceae bacterium]
MLLETQRLIIRDLKTEDAVSFVEMSADGSLNDVGFDRDCGSWIAEWTTEAKDFAVRDNPDMDYLAYTITLKEENIVIGSIGCSYYEDFHETGITYFIGAQYRNNGYAVEAAKAYTEYFFRHYNITKMIATVRAENISSWKVVEEAGFTLIEKRLYKDLNDDKEELYHFYEIANREV